MKKIRDISVLIGGKAGDGALFTGNILAKVLKRQGWEVATSRDFPSNIRGESTSYTIRASLEKIQGRGNEVDVLLAFDCDAIMFHSIKLAQGGTVLCDGKDLMEVPPALAKGKTFHKYPLRKLARDNFGSEIYKNMIAVGALSYILNLDTGLLGTLITERFLKTKGEEVVRKNIQAVDIGWKNAEEIINIKERHIMDFKEDRERILLSGDEAIGLGALAAGCRFFAAYPICPASEIWQWLVHYLPQFNGVVVQTEDELSALNMVLGAAYAGARAMTSTSGPGASLMMEAFSLAGMAEIPIVVAHVQRAGPSTGMPTKTQQSDLLQWIFGSHGEFPRIVISPGTVQECCEFTIEAFNLAEKYQCPVILLTELDMGQNYRTARMFDFKKVVIDRGMLLDQEALKKTKDFKRYEFTADGVSPRSIPSQKNGIHMVEGNEHDEHGYRNEDPEMRTRMMEKRMKKLQAALKDIIPSRVVGDKTARVGIIAAGSTLGPVLEAMETLEEKGIPTKFLRLRTLWPFPAREVQRFIEGCDKVYIVENNFSGQLGSLIRSQVPTLLELKGVRKYSSLAFRPVEVLQAIERGQES